MNKLTDVIPVGEIVIAQKPHQSKMKFYHYENLDKAFENFCGDKVAQMSSLKQQIEDNLYDEELDGKIIQNIKDGLKNDGLDEDTPYYEILFDWTYDKYHPISQKDKERILSIIAADDMSQAIVFVAQENMTYKDFSEKIFKLVNIGNDYIPFEEIYEILSVEYEKY